MMFTEKQDNVTDFKDESLKILCYLMQPKVTVFALAVTISP